MDKPAIEEIPVLILKIKKTNKKKNICFALSGSNGLNIYNFKKAGRLGCKKKKEYFQ